LNVAETNFTQSAIPDTMRSLGRTFALAVLGSTAAVAQDVVTRVVWVNTGTCTPASSLSAGGGGGGGAGGGASGSPNEGG